MKQADVHPILADHLRTGTWMNTTEVAEVLGYKTPKHVLAFAPLLGARKYPRPGSTARNQAWKWPPRQVLAFAEDPSRFVGAAAA